MLECVILGEYGPFPAPGGACSGYLLRCEGVSVLMDCGPGALSRLLTYQAPEALDAVVLSHLHFDHMSDLLSMGYALETAGRKDLPLYLPDGPQRVRDLLAKGPYALMPMEDFVLGNMAFSFCPARHPVPSFSLRVRHGDRALLYTGDTNWHEGLLPFAKGCDLVLADAALPEDLWSESAPHLCPRLCGELARDAGAGELALTHLRPDADSDRVLAQAREVFPEARLAREGMVLSLS
jgi:ribonuclease BN (tRNA processing enzyme)